MVIVVYYRLLLLCYNIKASLHRSKDIESKYINNWRIERLLNYYASGQMIDIFKF
jgi:hypothetical protein